MGLTKVTRNFQITLPRDVREAEQVKIGDRFMVTAEQEKIIMKKIKIDILKRCGGAWGKGISGVEWVRKVRDEAEERERRLGL